MPKPCRGRTWTQLGYASSLRELPFQDMAKESVAGKYQMLHGYSLGWIPLGFIRFVQLYGKEPHTINRSRFKLAEYDQVMGDTCDRRPARSNCRSQEDDRDRAHLRADVPDRRPDRLHSTVADGLRALAVRNVLEISRHRSRARGTLSWWTQALVVRQRLDGAARALRVKVRGAFAQNILAAIERHRCDAPTGDSAICCVKRLLSRTTNGWLGLGTVNRSAAPNGGTASDPGRSRIGDRCALISGRSVESHQCSATGHEQPLIP